MSLTNQSNPDKLQFAFNPPDYVDQMVLVANTAQPYSLAAAIAALGTSALYVNIQGEAASIAVNFSGQTAAFAGSTTATGTASAINPGVRDVSRLIAAGNNPSVVSRTGQNASIEIWKA